VIVGRVRELPAAGGAGRTGSEWRLTGSRVRGGVCSYNDICVPGSVALRPAVFIRIILEDRLSCTW